MEKMGRRQLLQLAVAGPIVATSGCQDVIRGASGLQIDEPFHGAVLNRHHGKAVSGGLEVKVSGGAPLARPVTVNGVTAERSGDRFSATVTLPDRENEIVASVNGVRGRQEHRIKVVWDRNSRRRYRFTVDDNIFFLRDLTQKQHASLFDNFYLDLLRNVHEKYGTRFCLNLYFTTGDGFDLTQVPERYKGEWKDNADWLKLSFHAQLQKLPSAHLFHCFFPFHPPPSSTAFASLTPRTALRTQTSSAPGDKATR